LFGILVIAPATAFILSYGAIPFAKRLAWHLDWVAKPAKDRWHETPVALSGGLVVVSVFALVAWLCGAPAWVMIGALALSGIGVVDDVITLAPWTKLLCQIPFAVAAAALVDAPHFLPWWLQGPAIVLWILTDVNAFNLIDGLDGLAAGLGMIACIGIAAIAVVHHDRLLAFTALSFCGSLGSFLIYNFSPASIYLGDAGSLPSGFILGVLCLDAAKYAGGSKLGILATPALLMAVPIIDTSIVIVTRLATGRAISNRGLDHCHHRLHNLGLSHQRVAYALWALGAAGGLWAVLISSAPGPATVIMLPICALMFATVGLFLANLSFEHEAPGRLYGLLPRLGRSILSLTYRRRAVEFALDFLVISSAYFGALLIHANFHPTWSDVAYHWRLLPAICAATYAAFLIVRIYRQMWRYAGIEAALRFQVAAGLAGLLATATLALMGARVPTSMQVLFVILLFNLLVGTRMSFRIWRAVLDYFAAPLRKVLVIGAGSVAESAARELLRDSGRRSNPIGFLDDDVFKHRMLVRGLPVMGGVHDIDRIYRETGFDEILIAQNDTTDEDLRAISAFARVHDVSVRRYLVRIDSVAVGKTKNGQAEELLARHALPETISAAIVSS
jgi:UDP-GlcNAc:undecaprenyl-phosphate/decaprenyl-phosphate GlcNAc-1-phosphate transferase